MNSELLAEARHAQERLIDAERDVVVARADFYRAVRRLHLHGSSLRELAADLGLSHQRVHQIVEEAGGSRRWLRTRSDGPPLPARDKRDQHDKHDKHDKRGTPNRQDQYLFCTFCGTSRNQARKLIAGPGVFICDGCVTLTRRVIADAITITTDVGPLQVVPEQQPRAQCNFCGKRRDQVAGQAGLLIPAQLAKKPGQHAVICDECLDLCDEIIAEEISAES
jgi:ClpX C4-type zinc finger protein